MLFLISCVDDSVIVFMEKKPLFLIYIKYYLYYSNYNNITIFSIGTIVKIRLVKEKVNLYFYGIDKNVCFHQIKGFLTTIKFAYTTNSLVTIQPYLYTQVSFYTFTVRKSHNSVIIIKLLCVWLLYIYCFTFIIGVYRRSQS